MSKENLIGHSSHLNNFITLYNNNNLPTIKNYTKNIIIYIYYMENFKKKRKKRFWEKLISDNNE